MNAADVVTPDGRCRWCRALVELIEAQAVEEAPHHLTGRARVGGVLYQLTPCGCAYRRDPGGRLERVDVDQVDEPAPPVRPAGRHRAPAPRRRWPAARRA